jgi:hypothetical protein
VVLLDSVQHRRFPERRFRSPVRAYTSKAQVLASYKAKRDRYESLRPILKDILALYDTIALDGRAKHTAAGGKGGKLAFVESRKRGEFEFVFHRREVEIPSCGRSALPDARSLQMDGPEESDNRCC